jgi:diaminohydroxyphosphoribosylaminopyrimidine deaminase/5-amino-6-(5-phosphoribosylamino)uracil reductase
MSDVMYMQRCLELAKNGEGTTSPNPLVGSVIVHNDIIIGEGWHYQSGLPHAEVNAIKSVKNKEVLPESTLYVSLEPCSHFGKTPPCANLIIEKKIPRVVLACLDPNPQVSGRGVAMLREAGVAVEVGILEAEATFLNRKFITSHTKQRPYITLKWAQTADGFIDKARSAGESEQFAISGPESKVFVHKLRATHDAILIGSQTAINDNPSLTTREFSGKNPVRMVLDRQRRLPETLTIFTDGQATWRFTMVGKPDQGITKTVVISEYNFLKNVMYFAFQNGIQSILVEGGATILKSFLETDLWDEALVISAPKNIGSGLVAPIIVGHSDAVITLGRDSITRHTNHGISSL